MVEWGVDGVERGESKLCEPKLISDKEGTSDSWEGKLEEGTSASWEGPLEEGKSDSWEG